MKMINEKGITLVALVVTVIGGNDECGMTWYNWVSFHIDKYKR